MSTGPASGVGDGEQWRFIVDHGLRGCSNMARDEAIAVGVAGGAPPTLRVYRFEPSAISIGRFQDIGRGIDLKNRREDAVEVVRRPTGGLAIHHIDDFTYSVTMPISDEDLPAKERCFATVAEGILESLSRLGVNARLSRHGDTGEAASIWCLESAFGIDLEFDGRKICGSAQRVFPKAILQHGTLFLKGNGYRGGITGDRSHPGKSSGPSFVTIAEACGREVSWEELECAFETGFSDALGVTLQAGTLCDEEEALARRLTADKYRSESWTSRGEAYNGPTSL